MPIGQRLVTRVMPRTFVFLCTILFSLTACATDQHDVADPGATAATSSPDAQTTPEPSASSEASSPSTVIDAGGEQETKPPKSEIIRGTDTFVRPSGRHAGSAAAGPDGVTLDFADADVKDVVRTVLGDILKAPYSIDPQVAGKITLRTTDPLAKKDVIAALETALKVNGAAIVFANGVYNVVPLAEAQHRVDGFALSGSQQAREPGYGIEIVPLHYVSVTEMQKILQPVAAQGSIVSADSTRNLLTIAGTGTERAAILDTIKLFDVDYLKGMSFALVRPEHVDVATLANELKHVFARTNGPIAGLVDFVPLSRINTLLVVSPRSAYLTQAAKWVDRLDVPPRKPGRRIYLYRLQNAKAQDIGQSLAAMFAPSPGAGGAVVAAAQAEPEAPPPQLMGSNSTNSASTPAPEPDLPPLGAPQAITTPEGLQIVPDIANNALIIRADDAEYAMLERFLREVDVAPDQVLIEATIAEVSLNDKLKYGVEWFFKSGDQTFNQSATGTVTPQFPGFAFTYVVPNVQVALNALGTVTDVNVISSPKLLTLNNRPALLQVGDQVPVITQTAVGINTNSTSPAIINSVQFRDTGVVLRVTPRIAKSGTVFIDVSQEVSDAVSTTTSDIDSPTIQQRKVASTVAVQDGETIALGGLIKRTQSYGDSGIPVLKDVPVLGKLFGSTTDSSTRTELLVFIKPRIIRNAAAAREMTEDLRQGLEHLRAFMTPEQPHR